MTVMTLGFEGWEYLWTAEFIITTILLTIIFRSSHWTVFNAKLKKMISSPWHKAFKKETETDVKKTTGMVEWKNYKTEFFAWRRVEKKKEAWKIKVQNEITKLTNKAKKKDLAIESATITEFQRNNMGDNELFALQQRYDEDRKNNKYCIQKRSYAEKLTDKWIAENLDRIVIDFDDVNSQFVEIGSKIQGQEHSQTNTKGKYWKDNGASIFAGFAITSFISAFTIDLMSNWGNGEAWALFGLRMSILLVNIIFGLDYADGWYRDVDEHDLLSRQSICGEFWTWFTDKGVMKKEA
jgi:hypothetical protein